MAKYINKEGFEITTIVKTSLLGKVHTPKDYYSASKDGQVANNFHSEEAAVSEVKRKLNKININQKPKEMSVESDKADLKIAEKNSKNPAITSNEKLKTSLEKTKDVLAKKVSPSKTTTAKKTEPKAASKKAESVKKVSVPVAGTKLKIGDNVTLETRAGKAKGEIIKVYTSGNGKAAVVVKDKAGKKYDVYAERCTVV